MQIVGIPAQNKILENLTFTFLTDRVMNVDVIVCKGGICNFGKHKALKLKNTAFFSRVLYAF